MSKTTNLIIERMNEEFILSDPELHSERDILLKKIEDLSNKYQMALKWDLIELQSVEVLKGILNNIDIVYKLRHHSR